MLNMKAKQAAAASSSEKNVIDTAASNQGGGGAVVKPMKTGRKKAEMNGEKSKSARKRPTAVGTIPMRENIRPNLGPASRAPVSAATHAAAKTSAPSSFSRKVLGPLNPNASRTPSRTRATQKQDQMQAVRTSGGAEKHHSADLLSLSAFTKD